MVVMADVEVATESWCFLSERKGASSRVANESQMQVRVQVDRQCINDNDNDS